MLRLKARKLKNGLFEILGLDKFIASKLAQLRRGAGVKAKRRAQRAVAPARRGPEQPLGQIVEALARHPRRRELLKAKHENQLLRSLVPLYLARNLNVEINSGIISRFWKLHGVSYASPNAAKALRQHVGFARVKGSGREITPNGIRLVEDKLLARHAA